MKAYVRKNVPGSSFRYCLAVLSKSATDVFKNPAEAEREAEQAFSHVQVYLNTKRVPEELRKNNKDDYEHSMSRLRMKWDRCNLIILKENIYEHINAAPPIGPAIKVLHQAVKWTIEQLDIAYSKAPKLKDERDEIEFEDPVIPEAPKVDYTSLAADTQDADGVKAEDLLT
jgi:hypothetical protein